MSLMTLRHDAVTETLDEIRRLRDTIGPSDALIDALLPALVALSLRADLFPEPTFRVNDGATMTIYELSADTDGRLGLYASAGLPGKYQPPHDHRTWSCIAGVRGAEWNRYFERVDDGDDPNRGVLEPRGEKVLRAGDARGMMGDRFHAIEVIEEEPALHLHLYGDTLDRLAGRIFFESDDGGEPQFFMARPSFSTALITPAELMEMFGDGEEIAVLDTRELGEWVQGHLLRSSPAPRSRFELDARVLLPRTDVRVVVIAKDNAAAHDAAQVLRRGGYRNVGVLNGGIEACRAAGMSVHEGMGTFEKAFGERVLTELGTPKMSIDDFRAVRASGEPYAFVDCRPGEEYENLRVPGAMSAPGATLLSAVEQLELDGSTPLIVSCAGRTRSIIAAQTLRDAGLPNEVFPLEGGAMGWKLAGGDLDDGPDPDLDILVESAARERAGQHARRLAADFGIELIDEETLCTFLADTSRSTYRFDVRLPDAHATGHRRGFVSAPGGQLVQEVTQHIAVHGARVVLVDQYGSEAIIAAHWLARMGFDVSVLESGLTGKHLITDERLPPLVEAPETEAISWHGVTAEVDAGAVLIDCSTSRTYRVGHIRGSSHCVRSELEAGLDHLEANRVLFTSTTGDVARFAAADAARLGRSTGHLIGGNTAWVAAGRSLTSDAANYLVKANDIWAKPYENSSADVDAMQNYLDWEVKLLETVDLSELISLLGPSERP